MEKKEQTLFEESNLTILIGKPKASFSLFDKREVIQDIAIRNSVELDLEDEDESNER